MLWLPKISGSCIGVYIYTRCVDLKIVMKLVFIDYIFRPQFTSLIVFPIEHGLSNNVAFGVPWDCLI